MREKLGYIFFFLIFACFGSMVLIENAEKGSPLLLIPSALIVLFGITSLILLIPKPRPDFTEGWPTICPKQKIINITDDDQKYK